MYLFIQIKFRIQLSLTLSVYIEIIHFTSLCFNCLKRYCFRGRKSAQRDEGLEKTVETNKCNGSGWVQAKILENISKDMLIGCLWCFIENNLVLPSILKQTLAETNQV